MIETLWTRAQIERVMLNFGRALDTGDWKLYRSCFADRFRVNFERLTGQPEVHVDADLWTRFAKVILSPVRRDHIDNRVGAIPVKSDEEIRVLVVPLMRSKLFSYQPFWVYSEAPPSVAFQ